MPRDKFLSFLSNVISAGHSFVIPSLSDVESPGREALMSLMRGWLFTKEFRVLCSIARERAEADADRKNTTNSAVAAKDRLH